MTDDTETPRYPLWQTYFYHQWRDSIIYGTYEGEVSLKDIFVQNEQMLKAVKDNYSRHYDILAIRAELGNIYTMVSALNFLLLGILLMLGYHLWRLYFA